MRIVALLALAGCAAHVRTEFVGTGNAAVAARGAPAPTGGGITLARGTYDIALRFDIPRAQVIDWRISCPGAEVTGAVGETPDAYRERRLGELRTMYERDRRVAATVSSRARVVTPVGTVTVQRDAEVAPVEQVVTLSPYDVGQGTLGARVRIATKGDGVCSIIANADDRIAAQFAVTRVHDLVVEARERDATLATGAVEVRGKLRARLVAFGADETARARREAEAGRIAMLRAEADLRVRREAELREQARRKAIEETEARARQDEVLRVQRAAFAEAERTRLRLEAEARIRWEADAPKRAHAELIVRQRTAAFAQREVIIAWLVGTCHGDAHRRERLEEETQIRHTEELRIRAEHDRQVAIRVEGERAVHDRQVAIRVEAERAERMRIDAERARRAERAFGVRTQVTGYLVALGAKPRPEPRIEIRGEPPFDGAVWASGRWTWGAGDWVWIAGGWRDSHRFGATGGDAAVVSTAVVVAPPTTTTVIIAPPTVHVTLPVEVHVKTPPPQHRRRVVRDHRNQ